jgi:prepilin-type N-terminal cleavage/methylation domain-containing protein
MITMHTRNRGFTLLEILVTTAIFATIMIGILNLLDTSTKISKLETALADTQENVRFAAYHIMRTTRMMGGAVLPYAADIGGTDTWVMGELLSNQTGTIATSFGNVTVLPGSDVLTVRGFFEVSPFFINRTDIVTTGTDHVIVQESRGGVLINNLDRYTSGSNLFEGRGIVFMGNMDQAQYAVGQVRASSALSGTAPDRELTIYFEPGAIQWSGLNPAGATAPPVFNTYRVGILESYTYYVRPDFTLMRLRADAGGATPQPVAINIGGLQVSLGVDTDNDGQIDSWLPAPAVGQIVGNRVLATRITVLGRTPFAISGWTEPAVTFDNSSGVHDMVIGAFDRSAKWRRIDVEAALRNYML